MVIREGRAETAPELKSLVSVVRAWDGGDDSEHVDVENPVAEVVTEAKRTAERKVTFSVRVQYRAVPSANRGRVSCGRPS